MYLRADRIGYVLGKAFVCIVLCLYCLISKAQLAGDYDLTASTASFIPITGGIDLDTIETVGSVSDIIPLGFTFFFENKPYNKVKVNTNGCISFDTSITLAYWAAQFSFGQFRPFLSPFMGLHSGYNPGSEASYKLSGSAPNRVFTMEWLYWGLGHYYGDSLVSVQASLYEGSNIIEFKYRRDKAVLPSNGISIGIAGLDIGKYNFLCLNSPTGNPFTSNTTELTFSTFPATNQVYRFTPPLCPAPYQLFYESATDSSILVTWKGWSNSNWNIMYDTIGSVSSGIGVMTGITTSYSTLENLAPNGVYEFRVRDSCGPGNSSKWSAPFKILTAKNVPYYENFDALVYHDNGYMANNWFCSDVYESQWLIDDMYSSSYNTGPSTDHTLQTPFGRYLVFNTTYGEPQEEVSVYSPVFHLESIDNPALVYWSHRYGSGFGPGYVDMYSNGSWKTIDSIAGSVQSGQFDPYEHRYFQLQKFIGEFVRFRWRGVRNTYQGDWAIDDVAIINNSLHLLEPKYDSTIEVAGSCNNGVKFKWQKDLSFNDSATYYYRADTNRFNLSSPLVQKLSNSLGSDTVFEYLNLDIDTTLASLSAQIGDTIQFYWTVFAVFKNDTVFSVDTFKVNLIRGKVMYPFQIVNPTDSSEFRIEGKFNREITFNWTKSHEGIRYILKLRKVPGLSIIFRDTTPDTSITMRYFEIDSILASLNILFDSSHQFLWHVTAITAGDRLNNANGQYLITFSKGALTRDFRLLEPSDDTLFVFLKGAQAGITRFGWEDAQVNGNNEVSYYWIIDDVDGNYLNAYQYIPSDSGGIKEIIHISHQMIQSIFSASNTSERDTFYGKWTAVTNLNDTANSFSVMIYQDMFSGNYILKSGNALEIFPNPTSGSVQLNFRNVQINTTVYVTNSMGAILSKLNVRKSDRISIELPEATGLYLIRIITGNTERSYRVIKN